MTVAATVGVMVDTNKDTGGVVMGANVDGVGVGANTGAAVGKVMVGSTSTRPGYVVTSCVCTALVAVDNWIATRLGLTLFNVSVYETPTPVVSSERRLTDDTVYPLIAVTGMEKILLTATMKAF